MINLIPLNIAASAILIGVLVVFCAVILAKFTTRQSDNNGLRSEYDLYQMRKH